MRYHIGRASGNAGGHLRKARLAAGYSSGRAAAEKHGWPIGTYTADEGGRRLIPTERADRYGLAFSVPGKWLRYEPLEGEDSDAARKAMRLEVLTEDDVPREFVSPAIEAMASPGAGSRLARARMEANFRSVRAAARHLGLPASTCHAHENGRHNLGERVARLYGAAYGADLAWLMTGFFPTDGSGRTQPIGNAKASPDEIAQLAADLRRPAIRTPDMPRLSREALAVLYDLTADPAPGPFLVVEVGETPTTGTARTGDKVIVDAGTDRSGTTVALSTTGGGIRITTRADGAERPPGLLGRVLLVISRAA